jgi:hypothetical protein
MPPTKMILHTKSEKTLEVTVDEARELWEELNKVFGQPAIPGNIWPIVPVPVPNWGTPAYLPYWDPSKWYFGDPLPPLPSSTGFTCFSDGIGAADVRSPGHTLL